MHLESHIASYQEALLNNPEIYIRNALLQLDSNPLVQVISFMNGDTLARVLRTLSAVSPQLRLDAETMAWTPDLEEERVAATVRFKLLHFRLRATAKTAASPQLAHSMWWAAACRLPIKANVNNARSDVLRLLAAGSIAEVQSLNVTLSVPFSCTRDDAPPCNEECGTFLCSLHAFPNLRKLTVQCGKSVDGEEAAPYVSKVLQSAAQLPISEVCLKNVTQLGSFSSLSGAPHLKSLTAKSCGIVSLSELMGCPFLTHLDVADNPLSRSLKVLAGLPNLEKLNASGCNLKSLEGVGTFPKLRDLDVSSNDQLETTRGLGGAPRLEKLIINCCETLASLEGLGTCPLLANLDVQFDYELHHFHGLEGAPNLAYINANGCNLSNVDGLGTCPLLADIDVSENGGLRDLGGLAGAASLRYINATDSGVRRLSGLGRCPALVEVQLNACEALEDISGLAGAPSLEKVSAMNCQVSNVYGLGSCPRLAELGLSGNDALVDVRDLARCPSLRHLNLRSTGVTSADFFGPSVKVHF